MTLPSMCEDSAQNCGGCISSSLKSSTPWCESQDLILPNFCSFLCWRSIFDLSYIETILAGGYLGALLPFLCQRCFVKILSDLVSRLLMFSQLKLPENYIKFPILHCCIISFKDWLSEVWSNFFPIMVHDSLYTDPRREATTKKHESKLSGCKRK